MLKKSPYIKSFYKDFSLFFFCISISIFIFYSYQYIIRILPNSIKPDLDLYYNINNAQFGSFASTYYIGYVLLHIPLGIMISRIGAKITVSCSLALTGLGLLPLILESEWHFVIIGRFISGMGASCAAVAGFQIFRKIYPEKYARMLGYMMFFGLCTAKLSEQYLSTLFYQFQVNTVLTFLLLFALSLSILMLLIIPKIEMKNDKNILSDIKDIINNKHVVLLSLCSGLMIGSLEGLSDAWGSAFLTNLYPNMSKIQADYFISFIFTGMAIGNLALPYFADKYNMSYLVTVASCLGMAIPLLLIIFYTLSKIILILLFVMIGFFCAYQASTIAMITQHVPTYQSGLTATFTNMIIMSFASFFHRTISICIDIFLQYGFEYKVAYKAGISIIPISSIIAFFLLLIFARKTRKIYLNIIKK